VKGRDCFTASEAARIRELLARVRRAEPGQAQKLLRDQLRAIGFYISDWAGRPAGFTRADFDGLVARGLITIGEGSRSGTRGDRLGDAGGYLSASVEKAPSSWPDAHGADAPSIDALAAAACAALRVGRLPVDQALAGAVPDRPGLYAIYGRPSVWRDLRLGDPPDERPLYVGKAERSLVSRDLKTHFATGRTGQSSPRRSLAALLADELKLIAMPRRPANPEPRKWTHYSLEAPGDARLTEWMLAHLELAVWECPGGTPLASVESDVMRAWLPPLNLIGVTTPWTAVVRAARASLAQQAKRWAHEHGVGVD
jgi:GIY-YIG catalytic domain